MSKQRDKKLVLWKCEWICVAKTMPLPMSLIREYVPGVILEPKTMSTATATAAILPIGNILKITFV